MFDLVLMFGNTYLNSLPEVDLNIYLNKAVDDDEIDAEMGISSNYIHIISVESIPVYHDAGKRFRVAGYPVVKTVDLGRKEKEWRSGEDLEKGDEPRCLKIKVEKRSRREWRWHRRGAC